MSLLNQTHLQDEEAAYKWIEGHLWPEGPVCPHCGCVERISKMKGAATRFGLYKCYNCRKQFRVTVGTIFEKSHIALHLWLQAFYLIAGSKKGISSNQLHRTLGITLKSAWFMGHRIREAMRVGSLVPPMGGAGQVVEIDETIYGRSSTHPKGRVEGKSRKLGIGNSAHKNVILSLAQRNGEVRSFHVAGSTVSEVIPVVEANVAKETAMMTDKAQLYRQRLRGFASHDRVDHGRSEYVRAEEDKPLIHTNTVESYFGLFKRGMRGTYQHCKEKNLHRYLAEFDFRHNNRIALGVNDEARATKMVKGVVGKRLTYRTTGE